MSLGLRTHLVLWRQLVLLLIIVYLIKLLLVLLAMRKSRIVEEGLSMMCLDRVCGQVCQCCIGSFVDMESLPKSVTLFLLNLVVISELFESYNQVTVLINQSFLVSLQLFYLIPQLLLILLHSLSFKVFA